ncbi:glutathione S-transferase family protein [Salinisphaera sp. T31B1]|uniref:glutathione S-transferase family protein n=1 Tax=Salinisphaera sp. T31B1 TaxID=727963 RepID=UPI00333F22F3
MTPILYAHRLSQPCRAVEILLLELGAAYRWHEIDFAQGETRTRWFREQVAGQQTVPALAIPPGDDGHMSKGFVLAESHAIMRYLCRTSQAQDIAQRWYPDRQDPVGAARTDQWMAWHHGHLRRYDMFHDIMNLHLTLPMLKSEIQALRLRPLQTRLNESLSHLDSCLGQPATASGATRYLNDSDHPSIADLSMACELYQLVAVGYRFDRYPNVCEWLKRISRRTHFAAVSQAIAEQGHTIGEDNASYLDLDNAFA